MPRPFSLIDLTDLSTSTDMEPAGQAMHPGMSGPAAPGEGLHAADRPAPAAAGPGPAGEERGAGEGGRPHQPWPARAAVCGAQQAAGHPPGRPGVSRTPPSPPSSWSSQDAFPIGWCVLSW